MYLLEMKSVPVIKRIPFRIINNTTFKINTIRMHRVCLEEQSQFAIGKMGIEKLLKRLNINKTLTAVILLLLFYPGIAVY